MLLPIMWLILFMTGFDNIGARSPKTVKIINKLDKGFALTIHCKSGSDDLGVQVLQPNGVFSFTFKPNIWKTTLYFCSFRWNGKSYSYDIYDYKRDKHDGPEYKWEVKPYTACLSRPKNTLPKCHYWG